MQSITSAFESYEKKLEKQANFAADYYFPKWTHFFPNGEFVATAADMLRHVDMLYCGLKENVYNSCGKWKRKDESEFKSLLGKVYAI